ncbi:MAG: Hsp70 family protein, partial [bacterium]
MTDIIYGVDFGTSNSAISIMKDGKEIVIRGNSKADKTESSILFFPKWDMGVHFIGEEAIQQYIDSGMDGRLIQSIKSILPDTLFEHTWIHGKKYEIDDLVALIIAHLKRKADKSLDANIKRAVFGRPAVFSENRDEDDFAEKRLRSAANKAGFEEIHFQFEPIAAAFSYELRIAKPEIVLVADLGGGTSDFTIMRLDPRKIHRPDRKSDILATGGIHIGGNDFDS